MKPTHPMAPITSHKQTCDERHNSPFKKRIQGMKSGLVSLYCPVLECSGQSTEDEYLDIFLRTADNFRGRDLTFSICSNFSSRLLCSLSSTFLSIWILSSWGSTWVYRVARRSFPAILILYSLFKIFGTSVPIAVTCWINPATPGFVSVRMKAPHHLWGALTVIPGLCHIV